MPSWPSRLLLGTSAPSSTSSVQRSPDIESPPPKHGPSKTTPRRVSASTSSSSRNRPAIHGRSLSHPFTSRLHGDRQINRRTEGRNEFNALDTVEDEDPGIPSGFSRDHVFTGQMGSLQHNEKNLVTGKCATCGSFVRWPKDVDVFRCTICLMVNDLTPASKARSGTTNSNIGTTIKRDVFIESQAPRRVTHVSIDRTKALVEQSISQYLQSRLDLCSQSKEDHPEPIHGILDATGGSNESTVRGTRDILSVGSRVPAAPPSVQELKSEGMPDISPESRLTLGPTKMLLPSSASPDRPDRHNLNAASAAYVVPSPTRKPPPPPVERPDSMSNNQFPITRPSDSGHPKYIFRLLENYLVACFDTCDCLNNSFLTSKPAQTARAASEDASVTAPSTTPCGSLCPEDFLPGLDAKTLLLGDFAENGMWWTGNSPVERHQSPRYGIDSRADSAVERVSLKTPRIDWTELGQWYHIILSAGQSWQRRWQELQASNGSSRNLNKTISVNDFQEIEADMVEASIHLQRALLKATENVLRRPGRSVKVPEDGRFLLMLLANPVLYPPDSFHPVSTLSATMPRPATSHVSCSPLRWKANVARGPPDNRASSVGKHSGIIKRILGLISNTSLDCNHHFVIWFSKLPEAHFRKLVDLVGSFVTYRLSRQHGRKHSQGRTHNSDLIPNIAGPGVGTSAQLHTALGIAGTSKVSEKSQETITYGEDWQIKAAARVMSLLFSANSSGNGSRYEATKHSPAEPAIWGSATRQRVRSHRQILPTNSFYNTLLDYSDLVADFESWESRRGKFSFCQYPMFLSIWAKIHIMEYDARRQMEIKAREAFFTSIMNRKAVSQHLVFKVRRECLVEDSLRGVSEAVGAGQEEIKKGLRIEFSGEEGVDAGGLRKEWFLLLVREVFDPEHGLFTYDEESHYCYFNPNSFETSDQFFLVGAVLGLAIYNSTILDVALPPFAFRKLIASAPTYSGPMTSSSRPVAAHTLEDLAELRPSLAKGLAQLLEYEGDVEETYCWDFVAQVDRYGQSTMVPLCPDGKDRPVTQANRREFVHLYIKYLLDTAVARQYEPFKRGFFTVCGGNALSLFRPEEIELLVRGSDEPLDIATLRAVAIYDGWGKGIQAQDEPVVAWFWDAFANSDARDQRKLLSFITSSDRIPAMGATNLVIKITCLGGNCDRFPIARTCFNMIGIYRYQSREIFEMKLWRSVTESEGFGLR